MRHLPNRLLSFESFAVLTIASLLLGISAFANQDEVIGTPVPYGENELVVIRGVGTVLRDKQGKHLAIWDTFSTDVPGLIHPESVPEK